MLVAATAPLGCGYRHGELYPAEVRAVALPIFDNRTFWRGVEFDLTEALAKEIELRTPYKIVRRGAADTTLTGTITDIQRRVASVRRVGGMPQELELTITVDFEWRSERSGDTLRKRQGFSAVGRQVAAQPVGEPYQSAQHQAVAMLAREIVSAMRADWGTPPGADPSASPDHAANDH